MRRSRFYNRKKHFISSTLGNSINFGDSYEILQRLSGSLNISGNVGIGTTNPDAADPSARKLVVYDTANNAGITIRSGNSGNSSWGSLFFADGESGSAAYAGFLRYNHYDAYMALGTEGTERVRIDAGGQVGIGTSDPGWKLHVENGQLAVKPGSGDTGVITVLPSSDGDWWNIANVYNGNLVFGYGDKREANDTSDWNGALLTLTNGDKVGIGTIYPSSELDVDGDIRARGDVQIDDDLNVNGDLDVSGSKNFRIDHPTKKGMYLVHSAFEGPESGLIYRGKAHLKKGKAVIKLPAYFERLTKKEGRTVHLTCVGGWSPLFVDGEVRGNKFTVKLHGNEWSKTQKFDWLVMAKRDLSLNPKKSKSASRKGDLIIEVKKKMADKKKAKSK
jgi:hypothetical protein